VRERPHARAYGGEQVAGGRHGRAAPGDEVVVMERQTGLGRSLGDVLDSMTPAEPEPMTGAARALFEPEAVEERLESLMADVAVLRRRVRRLERLVPRDAPLADDAALEALPPDVPVPTAAGTAERKKGKKAKGSKGGGRKRAKREK
jgi:hypothetical protein